MTGDFTDHEEEKRREERKDYSEVDSWGKKLAMTRIVKKSGCQNLKGFPLWLSIKKISPYSEWHRLCNDDLKSKREGSYKRANNVHGNYYHFRKVAG